MAIKTITFTFSGTSKQFIAFGGIRFYNQSGIIPSGSIIKKESNFSESTNFIMNSTSSYSLNYYNVFHAFDTSRNQQGTYNQGENQTAYWLSSSKDNQSLSIVFKQLITSISRIEFIPNPDIDNNNRGITNPFLIEVKDENDKVITIYTVNPTLQQATVQSLSTGELMGDTFVFIKNNDEYKKLVPGIKYIPPSFTVFPKSALTSNTSDPNFIVSVSKARNTGELGFKAFDKNESSHWYTGSNPDAGTYHWLKVDLTSPKKIKQIKLMNAVYSGATTTLKEFKLYGSNDDLNYELLLAGVQQNNLNWQEHSLSIVNQYRYYKLEVINSYANSSSTVGIREMELLEEIDEVKATPSKWEIVSSDTPDPSTFQQLGMRDLTVFDRKEKTLSVIKIENPETLGNGKIFKQRINFAKYPSLIKTKITN